MSIVIWQTIYIQSDIICWMTFNYTNGFLRKNSSVALLQQDILQQDMRKSFFILDLSIYSWFACIKSLYYFGENGLLSWVI